MSYGIQQWGLSGWGSATFSAVNHFPNDGAVNIIRMPTISFTLLSQSGDVELISINLYANGIALIMNGIFTSYATGTINDADPQAVIVTATVTNMYTKSASVNIIVNALNSSNQIALNGTWQFITDNNSNTFFTYINRSFQRILKVSM